jgi:DNA topoisomerase-1
MGVPAHDDRDWMFADKYNLPKCLVIQPANKKLDINTMKGAYDGSGILVNSGKFTGMNNDNAKGAIASWLEEKGIGRPSTYAPTISTIQARGYVDREKKFLFPTDLGKIVNEIMKNHFRDIVDVQFTAQMEQKLDDVEEGEKQWVSIMEDFYRQFVDDLREAEAQLGRVEVPDEVSDVICEKCGRNMVIKMGRFGKFLACPGFPECRNAKPIVEEAGVSCPKCGGKVLIKKTRKGKKYIGCENNPKCDFMSWDMNSEEKCSKCGSLLSDSLAGILSYHV